MAHTSSNKKTLQSFFIVDGWSEGPWQSQKMQAALLKSGLNHAQRAEDADVIIAHSLGCYLVPAERQAKIIVLVGVPYWPGKPVAISVLQNTGANLAASWQHRSLWWLNKLAHNIWYVATRPLDTYHAFTKRRPEFLPIKQPSEHILLLRNRGDTFCHPEVQQFLPPDNGFTYVGIQDRGHEDCWHDPEKYLNLIRSFYG